MKNYKTLETVFSTINDLEQSQAVLHWDMATMMPEGGAKNRASQLATLQSISHAILADEGIEELINSAFKDKSKMNAWQKSNLQIISKKFQHTNAVPKDLLKKLTLEGANCELVWRKARAENDFKSLAPHLQKVVDLVREVAKHKSQALECSPYDALLDQYDPGRTTKQLDEVFSQLDEFLPDFIEKVISKQESEKPVVNFKGEFDVPKQKELALQISQMIGFDISKGRFDESLHPFCGGYKNDVRITTRYNEDDFSSAIMGVIHETGHAMYEANLPDDWSNQPVGQSLGMSVHESQSLIMEMQACRSREFLKFLFPLVKKTFAGKGRGWSFENFYRNYTKVQRSLIRVDADEVTYPAHVALRYRIEQYLIAGEMEVADLPEAWSQGMEKYLGVKPDSDKDGCMQDIHWMDGSFGYFPSYTIGAIYAAQQFEAAKKDNDKILPSLEKGKFEPLLAWLNENIHSKASSLTSDKLMQKATGSDLDVECYKNHLIARYLDN